MTKNQGREIDYYIESLKTHRHIDANFSWKVLNEITENFLRGGSTCQTVAIVV